MTALLAILIGGTVAGSPVLAVSILKRARRVSVAPPTLDEMRERAARPDADDETFWRYVDRVAALSPDEQYREDCRFLGASKAYAR